MKSTPLAIAVRAYSLPLDKESYVPSRRKWTRPEWMLVFDTETRIDAPQALTFGSYRFFDQGACVEEGVIHAANLSVREMRLLRNYVGSRHADVAEGEFPRLRLR